MRPIDADALIKSLNYTAPELFADREFLIAKIDNAPTVTHDKRTETHGVCSDLISRQAVKAKAHLFFGHSVVFESQIDVLPSADRPTGEWEIETDTDEYGLKRPKLVCSKCKKEPEAWDLTKLFEFCPNCGARMYKGGEEE